MVLLLVMGADPAVGRNSKPLIFNWDIFPCLWDPCYFSEHNKPSMTILDSSIAGGFVIERLHSVLKRGQNVAFNLAQCGKIVFCESATG